MSNRGAVDWLGNITYSDSDLADMRAESEAKYDQRMERRITKLVDRIGAMDGAIKALAGIVAEQRTEIAELRRLVGVSPSDLALASAHLPYSDAIVAPIAAHAVDRR
jgi:hypothetical protein